MSANGTNTAVIYFGGNYSPGVQALNESWNGSAWTEVGDLNAARSYLTGIGTQTAALAVGGSPDTAANESWNGSAWTEVGDMNTAGDYMGGSSGTQTSALVFGGDPGNSTKTESWDGTSWTEVNNLGTGRDSLKGAGSNSTSALAYGGYTTTDVANTEEFSFPPATASTLQEGDMWFNSSTSTLKGYGTAAGIPAATWGSGGNVNTARNSSRGMGTVNTAMIAAGGYDGTSAQAITEQYDGTSWTEVNDMNTAKSQGAAAGQSPYQNSIYFAGSPALAVAETWNGTSWTEVADLNTGRRELANKTITAS